MPLQSSLFQGDAKLEAAAVSDPAHIATGASGPHVAKIQTALNTLIKAALTVDGKYGPLTAAAVQKYKTDRKIINTAYQNRADNIVGKMTVAAMDRELSEAKPPEPPTVVIGRPSANPVAAFAAGKPAGAAPKLSAVVRGNPYVRSNAQFAQLPPSVPPGHSYEVDVTVTPALTGNDFVDLEVAGESLVNGGALVRPPKIQQSTRVIVLGFRQTEPGNAGKLKLQASFNGKVLASSEGFSVCAHPNAVSCALKGRLTDGVHTGIAVAVSLESDSGAVSHLDRAEFTEIVNEIDKNSPPYPAKVLTVQELFLPCIAAITDEHGSVLHGGPAGSLELFQVYVFRCNRCGGGPVAIPAAGFRIFAEVKKSGGGFQQVVRKAGKAVGVLGPASMRRNGVTPAFRSNPGKGDILGAPETIREKS